MSIDQTFPDEHYYLFKEKEKREETTIDMELYTNQHTEGYINVSHDEDHYCTICDDLATIWLDGCGLTIDWCRGEHGIYLCKRCAQKIVNQLTAILQ